MNFTFTLNLTERGEHTNRFAGIPPICGCIRSHRPYFAFVYSPLQNCFLFKLNSNLDEIIDELLVSVGESITKLPTNDFLPFISDNLE
ncbi:unnamed protein product [Ceratitis capitata]|uniref:(Mediterranean fruit fly) hypothetical protein n=1 Tax=Ceratitis capitata TaxID=7213 RepID=A0A811U5A9_CERCA|nr:unnamed protein product [Ceratitis capitata]